MTIQRILLITTIYFICIRAPRLAARISSTGTTPLICKLRIRTAADLQAAFRKASTDVKRPPTVINVCQEQILVPPLFNITNTDKYGFNIQSKNIKLVCKLKLCTLQATGGTGLFYLNNSTLTISGFMLSNGGSIDHTAGGAIYTTNSSSLYLENTIIFNNIAQNGGGLYSNYTEDFERSFVSGSKYSLSTIGMSNTSFIGNKAINGGAIKASYASIQGKNVTFQQNEGSRLGGAIGLYRNCTVAFQNSTFDKNYASGYGGAIYTNHDAHVMLTYTKFLRNAARLSVCRLFGD